VEQSVRNIYENVGMCWKVLWVFPYFHNSAPIFVKLSGRLITLGFATTEYEMKRMGYELCQKKIVAM
jgi:hypothetical protein